MRCWRGANASRTRRGEVVVVRAGCGHAPLREQRFGAHHARPPALHSYGDGVPGPASSGTPTPFVTVAMSSSDDLHRLDPKPRRQTSIDGHSHVLSFLSCTVRRLGRRVSCFAVLSTRSRPPGLTWAECLEGRTCGFQEKTVPFPHNIVTGRPVSPCPLPVSPKLNGHLFLELHGPHS